MAQSLGRGSPSAQSPVDALVAAIVLTVAVLAMYARTLNNEFCTLDDDVLIVTNQRMIDDATWATLARNVSYFWQFPRRGLSRPIEGMFGMYMPMTYSLWTVLLDFSRPTPIEGREAEPRQATPELFHAASIALHLANAMLVWLLLSRLVRRPAAALAGALLFACHPTQVEAVAWISETKGVLCALFGLAAMLVFLGPRPLDERPGSLGRYVLATGLFVLALLSKPAAVSIPLMLLVLETAWCRRRILPVLAPLGLWISLAVGMAVLTKTQQPTSALSFVPTLAQRPWVLLDTLGFYLLHLAWPAPLGVDYGRSPEQVVTAGFTLALLVFPLTALLLACLPGRRTWLTGLALFVVVVLPISGLISFSFQQYSTVADRYTYLALVGPALALAWMLSEYRSWLLAGLAALGLMILGGLSFRQTGPWESNLELFHHALLVNPASWLAEFRLATLAESNHEPELAETHYRRLFAIKPDFAVAHCNLGNLLRAEGRNAEALEEYHLAVAAMPDEWRLFVQLGLAQLDLGQRDAAVASFSRVVELRPDRFEGHHNLGLAELEQGRFDRAQQHLVEAHRLAPRRADTLHFLGLAYAGLGDYPQAISKLRLATRGQGVTVRLVGDLAWLLAVHEDAGIRRPAEAEKLARQACLATGFEQPLLVDVLAVATAAAGRMSDAQRLADRALNLAQSSGDAAALAEIKSHRDALQAGHPWTETAPRGRPWPAAKRAQVKPAAGATSAGPTSGSPTSDSTVPADGLPSGTPAGSAPQSIDTPPPADGLPGLDESVPPIDLPLEIDPGTDYQIP